MSLQSVTVKNFSVFSDGKIELAEGVNVFMGSNGTGKTHLLKGIYGCCELSRTKDRNDFLDCFQLNTPHHILARNISKRICSFSVSDGVQNETLNAETILIKFQNGEENQIQNKNFLVEYWIKYPAQAVNAVYIPVKDMLTHSKGLLAMANRYKEFPFDKTLLDIIDRAQRWTVKTPSSLVKRIAALLENCIK